jgi:hypothetical protein
VKNRTGSGFTTYQMCFCSERKSIGRPLHAAMGTPKVVVIMCVGYLSLVLAQRDLDLKVNVPRDISVQLNGVKKSKNLLIVDFAV